MNTMSTLESNLPVLYPALTLTPLPNLPILYPALTLSPLPRGTDKEMLMPLFFFFFPVQSQGIEPSAAAQGGYFLRS